MAEHSNFNAILAYARNSPLAGNGSPESVVVAEVGTLFLRRDGGPGNSVYIKQAGSNQNIGWVPAGPHVTQTFSGLLITQDLQTDRPVFQDTLMLGVDVLQVYLNGILLREGADCDYTVSHDATQTTVSFLYPVTSQDVACLTYLPA